MTIYTVDFVNHKIRQESYDNVADLQAFTREMDYLHGEWFDNLADAKAELQEYEFDNAEPDYDE